MITVFLDRVGPPESQFLDKDYSNEHNAQQWFALPVRLSDSIALNRGRTLADTVSGHTDTLVLNRGRPLSDSIAISDAAPQLNRGRSLSDTLTTPTDTINLSAGYGQGGYGQGGYG